VCAERSSSPYAATSSLLSHMFPERGEEMTATRKARRPYTVNRTAITEERDP
jgi:hypothetical protein